MPWKETTPMEERIRFVVDHRRGLFTLSELCRLYGISRKTGYKWLERCEREGLRALEDRSHAPRSCPHRTDRRVIEQLIEARQRHPRWGARKLLAWLEERRPERLWPAPSTAGDILSRHGLVRPRRRRRPLTHPGKPQTIPRAPNELWTADFKGEFRLGDGTYCYPLTVADCSSRFLLGCRALASTRHEEAQPVFERLFREYGLPQAIRTDNGAPFATTALGAPFAPERLVAQARHPPRAHRALAAAAKRHPRADA